MEELDDFAETLKKISLYLRANYPALKFGTTLTFERGALTNDTLWKATKDFSNILSITYWPLHTDFTIRTDAVEALERNISELLVVADGRPLIIKEAGLPSSELCGGSKNLQAEFAEELFIRTKDEPQIEIVGWGFLADFNKAETVSFIGWIFIKYLRRSFKLILVPWGY